MDAGLRDDAARAKGLLINEIQRGDMARGGQTVSPNLKDKGDERLFKGAKEAIRQGLLTDPSDIEVIADKLSTKQLEELNALMTGAGRPPSTLEEMIPVTPTPNLSTTGDTIGSIPEFNPAGSPPRPEPWSEDMLPPDDGFKSEYLKRNADRPSVPPLPTNAGGLPPDMGLPMPDFGSPLATPEDAGLLSAPQNPIPMGPAAGPEAPAEDPIIELAGTASTKDEALAIADEAEASGLFPGARAKVMKAFGWDEEGAQNFGRALMGFGSGSLQGGPDFGAALGAGFAKGADEFVDAKDDRRQAALDDRRIAMEDERLDFAREEMNNKRKQAALDRLSGEAAATQSGLIYYEDGEGRIRSRQAPLQEGPQDEESKTDLDRLAQWIIMDEGPAKDALGRKWGFLPKEATTDPLLMPAQ